MSSSERQVADVLGPQAFVGITGGTDTLGNIKKFYQGFFDKNNIKHTNMQTNLKQNVLIM